MNPVQDRALTRPVDRTSTRPGNHASVGIDRPSTALRNAFRRSARAARLLSAAPLIPAPSLSGLVGAAIAAGVASGFLEVLMLFFQVHGLHRVGLWSMRISRHAAWMIPAAEAGATLASALVLIGPALAWSAWRRRRGGPAGRWVWTWSGLVLGTLLFLGPMLAIRRMHPVAAMVLAIGAGSRFRLALVRPTPGWRLGAIRAGVMASVVLASFSAWRWDRVTHADERAWVSPATPTTRRAPNLIWIVMDTVRADHMSLHGYDRKTTPNLDRWARLGIAFDRARAAAPWTLPSHLTMFTGLWPYQHGGRIDRPYSGDSPTMAEHLAASGYATAGLAANTGMCNATYGLGRGFDRYVELVGNQEVSARAAVANATMARRVARITRSLGLPAPDEMPEPHRRLAPTITADARDWIGRVHDRNASGSRRPFFLFMNFMDVHSPYVPLPASGRAFFDGKQPPRKESVPEAGWKALHARDAASPADRADRQRRLDEVTRDLVDLYDDCLRGLDAELGRFLDSLKDSGTLDNTWIVIAADHGEEFGEHGIYGHGASLYSQVTHVPLILIPPLGSNRYASIRGQRIGAPVSLRDLPATLADVLLPGAPEPFPGRSLARFWRSSEPGHPDPILAQMQEQHFAGEEVQMDGQIQMKSLVLNYYMLIDSVQNPPELYNLINDPRNLHDLANVPEHRARRDRLLRELDSLRIEADSEDQTASMTP